MIASDDGLDTALARVLHEQGSVDLGSLQGVLEDVRARRASDPGLSLALALRQRELVSHDALEQAFDAIGERAKVGHEAAIQRLGIPAELGPYRVVRELSRGGMGAVHEIVHESSGVSFALKTILPSIGGGAGEEYVRFRREAEALGRLNHPHVVRVHAAELEGPVPYLIQDLLPGGTLQARIDRSPLVVLDALELIRQLGEGLAHAHERGVLHRDLKPLNVLFDNRDQARLVDFGLARFASGSSLTQTGQLLGTPAYMAPEQALGGVVDPRTDVYGLAGILFALLTGQPPFTGSGLGVLAAVVNDPPPLASSLNKEVPSWLDQVVAHALSKDPNERYPNVRAFLSAVEHAEPPPPRTSRRLPILFVLAMVVVVLAGYGVFAARRARLRAGAVAELSARLSPPAGAPPRFADLGPELARWESGLGGETAPLLLARGLAAIGLDQQHAAEQALTALRERPGDKRRLDLLEACCAARWSTKPAELRRAARKIEGRLRLRNEIGFLDYRLLAGRAHALTGDTREAIASFLGAAGVLDADPWRGLVVRAAAEAAVEGKLSKEVLHRLCVALPSRAEELRSVRRWAPVTNVPTIGALVEALEAEGGVPEVYRPLLKRFADAQLETARIPNAPPGTSPMADGVNWGERILDLSIRVDLPLTAVVYRALADWCVIARHLKIEKAEEVYAQAREGIEALGARMDAEHGAQRQRLFTRYLEASPTLREIGSYGMAASAFYTDQTRLARAHLAELTKDFPQPQRGFWRLWLDHLDAIRPPPLSWPQPARLAFARKRYTDLLAQEAWVRATAKNSQALKILLEDPATSRITVAYGNIEAIYYFSLARAALESGDGVAAVVAFEKFLPLSGTFPNKAWFVNYVQTIARLANSKTAPSGEVERAQGALESVLLRGIEDAYVEHLSSLLNVAWNSRGVLSPIYPQILEHHHRLLKEQPTLERLRVRAAWFALAIKDEPQARTLLRNAALYLNSKAEKQPRDPIIARNVFNAHADRLSLEKIAFLDHQFNMRHHPPHPADLLEPLPKLPDLPRSTQPEKQ